MSKRLAIYLSILLSLYLLTIFLLVQDPLDNDFSILYASAQLHLEGEGIYSPVPIERFVEWNYDDGPKYDYLLPNLNPPWLTLLMLPLAGLPYEVAFWVWTLASLVAGMIAILIVERTTRRGAPNWTRQLGFLILLLAFHPTWINLQYGQVSLFLFLLLAAAWKYGRSDNPSLCGLFLGLALALKLFVALFVLMLLVQRHLRTVVAMTLVYLATWGISLAVFGVETALRYREVLTQISWSADGWNASLLGFFTRIFGGSESAPLWDAPQLGRVLAAAGAVAAALILTWAAGRREMPGGEKIGWDLGFGLTLVCMLLISPLGWIYYFPMLLLPVVLAWELTRDLPNQWTLRGLLAGNVLLLGYPTSFVDAADISSWIDRFVLAGGYFYGLLVLGILLAWLRIDLGRRRSVELRD